MGIPLIYIDVPPSINPIAPLTSLNYWLNLVEMSLLVEVYLVEIWI